jgi:hypothetical protein
MRIAAESPSDFQFRTTDTPDARRQKLELLRAQIVAMGGELCVHAAAAPTTGDHVWGEIVWNSAPVAGGKIGWVCVATGTPGTWKAWGAIDA